MSIYVNNVLRIKRNALHQDMMRKLFESNIFSGYKDILMISAIIGYNENKYVPIEKVASDGVLMSFFNEKDYDIIDLIAYSFKREQNIIKDDQKYEIFSSFANGGFDILLQKLNLSDIEGELTEEEARRAQCLYYSMLLSGEFNPKEETVNDTDLFI